MLRTKPWINKCIMVCMHISEISLMRHFFPRCVQVIVSFYILNRIHLINFYFCLQGYTHPREYIVTEWPLPNTCSDIWSLVYDHDCSAVVVLCNPTSTVANVRTFFFRHSVRCWLYFLSFFMSSRKSYIFTLKISDKVHKWLVIHKWGGKLFE